MRLAYFISQYPAISHTFVRREIAALRSRGLEVASFSIRPPAAESLRTDADRAEFAATEYLLPVGFAALLGTHLKAFARRPDAYFSTLSLALRHRVPGARALVYALFHFAEAILLAARLEAARSEHLHSHFANSGGTIALLAAQHLGLPWSLTVHGSKAEFDYPAAPLLPEKVAIAKFVACVSHYGRSQLFRVSDPTHWEKLFVSRCGVELEAFPERVASDGSGPLRILCVGRLVPEKAQRGLVEAFGALVDRGCDAELILVGDGPDRAAIEGRAAELGLGEQCRLLGSLSEPEVLKQVTRCDVFAMSSLMEGLPVVLMEAMAVGVPVVAPRISGIPELVEDDATGLLYSAAHWSELADRLERLAADPALRRRLGLAGQRRVREEFAIETAVEPLFRGFVGGD